MGSRGTTPKPKYYLMTDSEKYSDGKLKEPRKGVKKNLKPYVYKLLKHRMSAIAYFFVERSGECMLQAS